MKMTPTSTENKQFAARYDAGRIFMLGGAPRAHEVLSESGFSRFGRDGTMIRLPKRTFS
jgi:hypothetical protein